MQDEALYKRRLLLFEDPALEAQPRHEVAVGVGRNQPVANNIVGPSTRFSGVHRFEDPVGTTAIVPNVWKIPPSGMVCIVWRCCVVLCNPFAMGDCDMFLLLLLFAWTVKTTNNPHAMLCMWPLELGIWTRACGPLGWGYGLTYCGKGRCELLDHT